MSKKKEIIKIYPKESKCFIMKLKQLIIYFLIHKLILVKLKNKHFCNLRYTLTLFNNYIVDTDKYSYL